MNNLHVNVQKANDTDIIGGSEFLRFQKGRVKRTFKSKWRRNHLKTRKNILRIKNLASFLSHANDRADSEKEAEVNCENKWVNKNKAGKL